MKRFLPHDLGENLERRFRLESRLTKDCETIEAEMVIIDLQLRGLPDKRV